MRNICWLLMVVIFNSKYGASQTENAVTFGVLTDNRVSSDFVKEALSQVWQENLSPSLEGFPYLLRFDDSYGFNKVDPSNASDVLQKVCSMMMTSSPSFLLYVTTCNDDVGIRYMADALNLPILRIESVSRTKCLEPPRCMRQGESDSKYFIKIPTMLPSTSRKKRAVFRAGQEFYNLNDRKPGTIKIETKLFWNIPNQISVGKYFASLPKSRLVFLYDYSFDFLTLQNVLEYLGDRMKSTIVQKLPINRETGKLVLQSSKTLIRNIVTKPECPNTKCNDEIIFAILCGEKTAKNIIAELLPFFRARSIRLYIVDIGWTKSFLKDVLFSKELTIITGLEKRVSQQLLPYAENLKYLKTQLKSTLTTAAKVLENSNFQPYYSMDANVTCGNEMLNMTAYSDYFVSSIKSAFGIADMKRNETHVGGIVMNNSPESVETYLNYEVKQYQDKYIINDHDKTEELKLCRLSGGRLGFKCKSITAETQTNEKKRASSPIPTADTDVEGIDMNNQDEQDIETDLDSNKTLENQFLRVVTIEDPPFVIIKRDRGAVEYYGFSIDLLKVLSTRLGFNYELYEVEDGKYGSHMNGSWDGLVGDLISKRADMAISAMTITPQKQQYIDFTIRYMDYTAGILTLKTRPTLYSSLFGFVRPFDSTVWYCILGGWFSVSILLFILNKISPKRNLDQPRNRSLRETFWMVFSTLTHQGSDAHCLSFSSQIVTGVWYFFVFIVVSSYIANLAANFTISRMNTEVQSFAELSRQSDIKYGTVRDTNIYEQIKSRSQDYTDDKNEFSIWKNVWTTVSNEDNSLSAAKDGIRRVKEGEGKYAFIWDSAVIDYLVGTDSSCSLTSIKDAVFGKGYGIGLQKGSFMKDILSFAILELEDEGIIQELKSKLWERYYCMPPTFESKFSAIDLDQFAGLFCILGAGLFVGSVVAMCEVCIGARKVKQIKSLFDGNNTNADEKYVSTATKANPDIYIERSGNEEIRIIISGVAKSRNPSQKQPDTICYRHSSTSNKNSNRLEIPEENKLLETISNSSIKTEKNGTMKQT